ncbi:MAG: heavy metal translocating P-type ATPase [Tepidisphaerales bacterium]
MSRAQTTLPPDANQTTDVCCAHCHLPVPPGLVEPSGDRQFCCAGCRAVYETIHACGLESYYKLVESANATLAPPRPSDASFESFDSEAFHKLFVRTRPDRLSTCELLLEGVTCAACVWLVERLPRVLDGVIEARLSLRDSSVRVTWDPSKVPLSRITRTLNSFGYRPHPAKGQSRKELHRRHERRQLIHLGLAGALAGNVMLLAFAMYADWLGDMEAQYRMLFRWVSLGLGALSLAWPGGTFFRSAWAALRTHTVNLDLPIALALLVGGLAGLVNTVLNRGELYFDSLTLLVFLLLVGRWMQFRQQRRADDAVELLFSLTPSTCRIVRADRVVDAPVEALRASDLVEVRSGELIPADGAVESGESSVNESLLTGESRPVDVSAGSMVHAGSQNVSSTLRVRVKQVGAGTRVGKLLRLVEQGAAEKAPIVQFADRVGLWFLVAVTAAAAGVLIYWSRFGLTGAIDHTVAMLIVTCPCVLGLATPLTISVAIGRLARRGILVKSGPALELLSRRGRLLLDKTGTLTHGDLQLVRWIGDESVRPLVAALEQHSTHPVARALAEVGPASSLASNVEQATPSEGQRGRWPYLDPSFDRITERDGGISGIMPDGRMLRVGSRRYMESHQVQIPLQIAAVLADAESGADNSWHGRLAHGVGAPTHPPVSGKTHGPHPNPLPKGEGRLMPPGTAAHGLEAHATTGEQPRQSRPHTAVLVAVDTTAVALAMLGDRVREDSAAATARLSAMGWEPSILSGDAETVVTAVAKQLRISDARAQMTPEEKLAAVKSSGPHELTVMVGDGVNDAAALAAADVGIAVHGGAEASLAAADVYISRPGLTPLVELTETSRHTMRVIRRNFAISLAYNLLAGTLAAMGKMNPLIAAILMPLSSATVLSTMILAVSRRKPE